jgi:hypothetical protein
MNKISAANAAKIIPPINIFHLYLAQYDCFLILLALDDNDK